MAKQQEATSPSKHQRRHHHHHINVPGEDTPLLHDQTTPLSSQPKTFANVFIAVVGAGVLGLPYTFKRTGWLLSLLAIFVVAALTYHSMMLLVYTRRKLESGSHHNGFTRINSFGDMGFAACGSVGRFAVDVMIFLSQVGFCIGYLIFIAGALANIFHQTTVFGFSAKAFFIWCCFPFQLALSSIAKLTHLAPLSIFADIVDLGAMAVVMVEDVAVYVDQKPQVEAFKGFSLFLYGIGVVLYTFEGVGMILPLEAETKDKDKFGMTLGWSMLIISVLYAAFGVLGYFAFGEDTKDIITANLGPGFITLLVQLGLCINLFFTFPLMLNPVYEIVERRFRNGEYCLWSRWLLVLVASLVALFVPNFADFMSLVGSSICCGLAFVLPALFHLLVFKEEIGWEKCYVDIGIVLLGIVLGISGTWYAILEILNEKSVH